jgi:hypothetical protein
MPSSKDESSPQTVRRAPLKPHRDSKWLRPNGFDRSRETAVLTRSKSGRRGKEFASVNVLTDEAGPVTIQGTFSQPDSQPCRLLPPVYASLCTSRYPTQNSGPSGLLVLSRRVSSTPASYRFIPAHCNSDMSTSEFFYAFCGILKSPTSTHQQQ